MVEIELTEGDVEPRDFHADILAVIYNRIDVPEKMRERDFLYADKFRFFRLQLREQIINQSTGSRTIHQKYHYDKMVSWI